MEETGLSYLSPLLVVGMLAGWVLAAAYIFRKSLTPVYPTPFPEYFTGGMVFVGIFLFLRLIGSVRELAKSEIWMDNYWMQLAANIENRPELHIPIYTMIIVLTLMHTLALAGSIFCIFLYYRKRDIFPRVLTGMFIVLEGLGVIVLLLSMMWTDYSDILTSTEYIRILFSWGLMALVAWYVLTSEKSKVTFVLPHPSLVNHEANTITFDFEEQEKREP